MPPISSRHHLTKFLGWHPTGKVQARHGTAKIAPFACGLGTVKHAQRHLAW